MSTQQHSTDPGTTRLYITECPRDAMQGIHTHIPTGEKIAYINKLLKVGFDVLDAGSFVSPKAIPQLADTREVFTKIDHGASSTRLLAIVANLRGAEEAVQFDRVHYIGFPFSVSETFQKRNTNSTIEESLKRVEDVFACCNGSEKELLIYLSMAFGNPYGDEWSSEIVYKWALKMKDLGVRHIALADTTGVSTPEGIHTLFSELIPALPGVHISAHLHALPQEIQAKTASAWKAGCHRFDTALHGYGGCPMAADSLTGNMATELVLAWCKERDIPSGLDAAAFEEALEHARWLFKQYQ